MTDLALLSAAVGALTHPVVQLVKPWTRCISDVGRRKAVNQLFAMVVSSVLAIGLSCLCGLSFTVGQALLIGIPIAFTSGQIVHRVAKITQNGK